MCSSPTTSISFEMQRWASSRMQLASSRTWCIWLMFCMKLRVWTWWQSLVQSTVFEALSRYLKKIKIMLLFFIFLLFMFFILLLLLVLFLVSEWQEGSSEAFCVDKRTRVPVYDTYQKSGKTLMKLFEAAGVDLLLFDIQDVGARFYTYIWTLYDCMVAAAMSEKPIKVVVADRPNPLGGVVVDGPVMEPAYSSFVGRKATALRHGMTVGELARLFNAEFVAMDAGKQVELEVVKMEGWHRSMLFSETKLVWVPPSPNLPSPNSALLYMGMCLFEGTNCSEGRGTALPFELIGAPYIDEKLIAHLRQQECPGVLFREASFKPSSSKFSGTTINGIQTHIMDHNAANPLRTALTLIAALRALYPDEFRWRQDGESFWLDLLVGNRVVREMLGEGATADEVMASWQDDVVWFGETRSKYLLYD